MKTLVLTILASFTFGGVIAPYANAKVVAGRVELTFPDDKMPDVEKGWIGLDFVNDKQIENPGIGSAGWDLRFKQMYPGTNQGKVLRIKLKKGQTFDSIKIAPADESEFANDEFDTPPGPGNQKTFYSKAMMKWCSYIWQPWLEPRHGCSPNPVVFILKTADGRFAKVQIVRYVKNGKELDSLETGAAYAEDGKVHVVLRYAMNSTPGDLSLE